MRTDMDCRACTGLPNTDHLCDDCREEVGTCAYSRSLYLLAGTRFHGRPISGQTYAAAIQALDPAETDAEKAAIAYIASSRRLLTLGQWMEEDHDMTVACGINKTLQGN